MKHALKLITGALILAVLVAPVTTAVAGLHPSYSKQAVIDTVPFYIGGDYDTAITAPNDFLTNPVGKLPNRYAEVIDYLSLLAEQSERVVIQSHGFSHEGRELIHLIISSPDNIANRETHRQNMAKIADPSVSMSASALNDLLKTQPAIAWLGYSIHGDEISGTDASVQLAYHLAAATDSATMHLLANTIVLIDPSENPDGRERYLTMLDTYRSNTPNYDRFSMQHSGVWPWGRTNHYWFDLNRDWILQVHPETRGRVRTVTHWHPVLQVDAHEMGSDATFLFSPPRQPINYNTPGNILKWYPRFGKDQAKAFDNNGWPYYTGEWNDQWYVGYGSAWPTFTGTVGILYEQAGVDGEFVRQSGDYILTYHESINHHFTSSLANIMTVVNNKFEILRDYREARAKIVADGRTSRLRFLFEPGDDAVRIKKFVDALLIQGIVVERATESFTVGEVTDIYHKKLQSKSFPAGTYLVSTAQPSGALAKAILEFDPHLKKEFLESERKELEKHGETRMYEISAWSPSLLYDIDAYATTSSFNVASEVVDEVAMPSGRLINPEAEYGFVANMEGELTYRLLNELFAEQIHVYASEKPFTLEGKTFAPGALVLRRRGNPDDLAETLEELASDIGIDIYGVNTGWSAEGSHLGAPTFRLLHQPRIALVAGSPMDYTSTGFLWHTIDMELGIPHSLINAQDLLRRDLSMYNVLVFPSVWGGSFHQILGQQGAQKLEKWASDGGTLIMVGQSAIWAADTTTGLSSARLLRQSLDKQDDYQRALERELNAEAPLVDTMALFYPEKVPVAENADKGDTPKPDANASDMDEWVRRFHPRGVIMQAKIDTEHWLSFGMDDRLPVMMYTSYALLSKSPVQTVARLTEDEHALRLAGLLWPEARTRWAGTAWATRERKGKGQLVLFATDPNMRGYCWGSRTLFVNAMLYGPGFTGGGEDYAR